MNLATICLIVVLVVTTLVMVVIYLRQHTMDQIREKVYQLFLTAERWFMYGKNEEKINWVIKQVRLLLPKWLNLILTDKMIKSILNKWYAGIKDLLDDGKIGKNKSDDIEYTEDQMEDNKNE